MDNSDKFFLTIYVLKLLYMDNFMGTINTQAVNTKEKYTTAENFLKLKKVIILKS